MRPVRIHHIGPRRSGQPRTSTGFTLVELLAVLAIVAVLLGLLLPLLMHARSISRTTVCANNLRQIGLAWQAYMNEHERFPSYGLRPDWQFGGVRFVGPDRVAVLDESRPLNDYLHNVSDTGQQSMLSAIYRCPSDLGIWRRDTHDGGVTSMLEGRTCFDFFGNSYRGNNKLLDPERQRTLALADLQVSPGRLLLVGDPIWYYASRDPSDPKAALDASWHGQPNSGNMAAADGSVRFLDFGADGPAQFVINPSGAPPAGN